MSGWGLYAHSSTTTAGGVADGVAGSAVAVAAGVDGVALGVARHGGGGGPHLAELTSRH